MKKHLKLVAIIAIMMTIVVIVTVFNVEYRNILVLINILERVIRIINTLVRNDKK